MKFTEMKDVRKHINQVTNQHTEIVDNDAIWAGIQAKMDKPKKRRPIFPLFIWGLSFLVITIVGISLYELSDNTISNTQDLNQNIFANVNENTTTDVIHPLEIKASANEQIKIDKKLDSDEVKIAKDKKTVREKSVNSVSSIPSTNDKISIINSPSPDHSVHNFLANQNDFNKKITTDSPTQTPDDSIHKFLTDQKEFKKPNITDYPAQIPNELPVGRGLVKLPKISTLLNSVLLERSKINLALIESPIPQHSYENNGVSLFSSITIYTQYGIGSKSIQSDSISTALRNQSEELMEQVRLGIEADLVNLLDFTHYAGVSYVSINSKVSSNETYYEEKEITYLKSKTILSDGTEVENIVTEDLPHLFNKKSIRYNSNRLISLPLGIQFGREFSKLKLSLGFGLDFNYGLSDEHTIVGNDGRLTKIPIEGKWFNPSLHSTFTIEYPLFERWYLHSKVMYRSINLEHTTIDNNSEEKYELYGIDLGLKIRF